MGKIEKIRQEVGRLMELNNASMESTKKISRISAAGYYEALVDVENFLDTLSEEPDKSLEDAIMEYYGNIPDDKDKVDAARHFAEWGAEHFRDITKMVGKSLEEAADTYAEKHGFRVPYDGSNNYYDEVDVKASKEGFIAGWKCRDDQMPMPEDTVLFQKGVEEGRRLEREDSVECEVTDVGFNYLDLALFDAESLELKSGDKVKVIVLKNNEDESK